MDKWTKELPSRPGRYWVRSVGAPKNHWRICNIRDIGGQYNEQNFNKHFFKDGTLGWYVEGWPDGWWEPCDGHRHPGSKHDTNLEWEFSGPVEEPPEE